MKRRSVIRWILLALFAAAILWVALGQDSCAQGTRALLGRKPDQSVLNSSFQVFPHSFRYYKFSLPAGSKNMALIGHFSASVPAGNSSPGNTQRSRQSANGAVEVYVLTEPAFESWRKAESPRTIYQSGRVSEQNVRQNLPAGDGVYYLVFSNRFDSASAKKVTAALSLHSTSWFSY